MQSQAEGICGELGNELLNWVEGVSMNTPVVTRALQSQERASNPDLPIVVIFCLAGLLLTLLALHFPSEIGIALGPFTLS